MNNAKHLMFLDTETSSIPRHWHTSPKEFHKWPIILQIAWQIYVYDVDRPTLVKKNSAYIKISSFDKDKNISICPESLAIHGITEEISNEKGLPHKWVMQQFHEDFFRYMPTLVAHCIDFDTKIIAAALHRIGITDTVSGAPHICTMHAGFSFCKNKASKMPSLQELHISLFGKPFQGGHNAIDDCEATKLVFFELCRRKHIILKNNNFNYSQETKTILKQYGKW